jgi:hypothetical protein
MNAKNRWRAGLLLGTFLLSALKSEAATLSAQGTSLVVSTGSMQVVFSGPDVVGITNGLTSETYLRNPSGNVQSNITLVQAPVQGLTPGNWTVTGSSASLTLTDSNRSLTITVSVDSSTQEVVVNLKGTARQGGLEQLIWGVSGFDMTAGKFVIPAQGGISITAASLTAQNTYSLYGDAWEAPLSVFQGNAGGVAIYSRDTLALCKDLVVSTNQLQTANEQFYVEAPGPWSSATQVGPVEWRIAAYKGGWLAGARIYRDWHLSAFPPAPLTGGRAWASGIQTVVEVQGGRPYQTSDLDALAQAVVPAETLLYLVNWRSQAYDVGYPDYSWDSSTPAFIAYAHRLGFRVMLHTDVLGVSPATTDYAAVQQYQLRNSLQ